VVGPDTTRVGVPVPELVGRDLSRDARGGGGANKVVCEVFRGFTNSNCGLLGGLLGNGGLPSPVSCGVIKPLALLFISESFRLLITNRGPGGASSALERAGGGSKLVLGRSGNIGGGSNCGLPGGVLNGEVLSCEL
jgi:hypothetical protein